MTIEQMRMGAMAVLLERAGGEVVITRADIERKVRERAVFGYAYQDGCDDVRIISLPSPPTGGQ